MLKTGVCKTQSLPAVLVVCGLIAATMFPETASAVETVHEAAADAHHADSSAGMPQMDVSTFPSQLFWLFVTFGILYLVFSKKSLPEISGVLENRSQHIQSDLETAESLKKQAQDVQHHYESALEKARQESTGALQKAQDAIKEKADSQQESFRKKAEKEIKAVEERLNKETQEAMEDMNTIAADVAAEAAHAVAGIKPDAKQARAVVENLNGNAKARAA